MIATWWLRSIGETWPEESFSEAKRRRMKKKKKKTIKYKINK